MEKILEILKSINDQIDYEGQTALIDDEILDSLELMQLIAELEAEYDISINIEHILPEHFNSPKAILELVTGLKEG